MILSEKAVWRDGCIDTAEYYLFYTTHQTVICKHQYGSGMISVTQFPPHFCQADRHVGRRTHHVSVPTQASWYFIWNHFFNRFYSDHKFPLLDAFGGWMYAGDWTDFLIKLFYSYRVTMKSDSESIFKILFSIFSQVGRHFFVMRCWT